MSVADSRSHVLITGAAGFVGRKLASRLRARLATASLTLGDHNSGVDTPAGSIVPLNVADAESVMALVKAARPTTVVHLAAMAAVSSSFGDPRATWLTNTIGTLNVALAIQEHAPDAHLLFVSSAEVYGRSFLSGRPVAEDALLLPANPYAATKAAADIMIQEAAARSLFATIVRPFNHTGPGQSPAFVVPSFCQQIARIERGEQAPEILVGELDDERDFLDVNDIVDGYVTIIERGRSLPNGLVLNLASSQPRRIGDVLESLLAMTKTHITVSVDRSRLRATRLPRVVGNATRAHVLLGWSPNAVFDRTLADTLDYWRKIN